MSKLVEIELMKVLHRKAIYVVLILIFIFLVLNNILILRDKVNVDVDEYLREAILEYKENEILVEEYELRDSLTYQEKIEYSRQLFLMNTNKYIIENKKNINDYTTLNYQFRTTLEDYEILIVILVIIVSSTILAEEFQKGTIKLLLIKPYLRWQILFSKYLVILIVMLGGILFLYMMQLLVGGIFLGVESLSEKVVIYNYQKSQIMCYNIFGYTLIRMIYKLPLLILISTFAYMVSVITSNSVISLTISLLLYIFTQSLNELAIHYNVRIMRYLLTTNWNFTEYLFGNIPSFKYITMNFSMMICIIYFIVMIVCMSLVFCKKDVKNI